MKVLLWDNFEIIAIDPLEEEIGADGKMRFIGFISGVDFDHASAENQSTKIKKQSEGMFSARAFENLDDAVSYARENYNFKFVEEIVKEKAEQVKHVISKYGTLTADEIEFRQMFDSFVQAGILKMLRGLIDDEPVCVLVLMNPSQDLTQVKINPVALLLTNADLLNKLGIELPFGEL